MKGSVRLTAQQDMNLQYLIDGSSAVEFRFGSRAQAMTRVAKPGGRGFRFEWKYPVQMAVDAARMIREEGARLRNRLWMSARAFDGHGQILDEPEAQPDNTPVYSNVAIGTAQALDGTWRTVPAIRKGADGLFCIDYSLWFEGRPYNGSISARSQKDAVEKLFTLDVPLYRAIVASLPQAAAPIETAKAAAPASVDLSGVKTMSRKEYFSIPAQTMQRLYAVDPVFKKRVDLMLAEERQKEIDRIQSAEGAF